MAEEEILAQVRKLISEHAGDDADRWWYANRYVFARLQLDERRTKTGVKARLFESGQPCRFCGKPFEQKKGVHIHRLDASKGYSDENCVLMHSDCHEKCHKEDTMKRGEQTSGQHSESVLKKSSKRYEGAFLYWWDIAPNLAERLDEYEAVEFVCADTGACCLVPVPQLKQLLLPERQTTRGDGNWEIKVLKGHEDEIAFGAGKSEGSVLFMPVTWIGEEGED